MPGDPDAGDRIVRLDDGDMRVAALDRIGAGQATVIGHSTGPTVATALAEQRPGKVAALALIDIGPSPDAKIPEGPPVRFLLARFPGRLLWHLKTEATIAICLSRRGAAMWLGRP